jgi:hypothetical protein
LTQETREHPRTEWHSPFWLRVSEVVLGLLTVAVAIVALANPTLGVDRLAEILSAALAFSAARMVASGTVRTDLRRIQALGVAGSGLLALGLVVAIVVVPGLSLETLVLLVAVTLTIQGLGRIVQATGRERPRWSRGATLATGVATVLIAGIVLLVQGIALATLIILLSVVVLANGVEMVVSGLRPSNRRQLTLLKLILFSAFYGLVMVNWIDLYGSSAPGYNIWVILTCMAPFGVLLVFQGLKDWQVAFALGLLVSLMNDLGYYFTGDLLFGFHVALIPWLGNQLGFRGNLILFTFQGGSFSFAVTSIMMGISIYARIAVVVVVLYHWWKHPARIEPAL